MQCREDRDRVTHARVQAYVYLIMYAYMSMQAVPLVLFLPCLQVYARIEHARPGFDQNTNLAGAAPCRTPRTLQKSTPGD